MHRYQVIIHWSNEDEAFVADVPELPGCAAHGDTHAAALANANEAIQLWIDTAEEFRDPIPIQGQRLMRRTLDWSRDNFSPVNWKGASFVPVLEYRSDYSHNPITVYCRGKVPRVQIKFGRMKNRNGLSDQKRIDLLQRLNDIPGVNLQQGSIDRYPNIPLLNLLNGDALEQFLKAIAWTIEEVKTAQNQQPSDLYRNQHDHDATAQI